MTFEIKRSQLAESLIYLEGKPFSLSDYQPFQDIYDCNHPAVVLMTGRQVGKCQWIQELTLMADGSYKRAGEICKGDLVASLDLETQKIVPARVSRVFPREEKPCRRLITRLGHEITVADTHPIRVWEDWRLAGELKVGERIASVRRAGTFGSFSKYTDEELSVLAFLLGDGGLSQGQAVFTKKNETFRQEYIRCIEALGLRYSVIKNRSSHDVRSPFPRIILDADLAGHKSATKFLPDFIFQLNKRQSSLFLNRLWSTDGHVKKNTRSQYDISYSSISPTLIKQVQALLWKFGIPSGIRKKYPEVYRQKGTCGYELRVETQPGIRTFLTEIGAYLKSENVPLPDSSENNNRDTFPKEINGLIQEAYGHACSSRDSHREDSLLQAGLRLTLKYPPSQAKLAQYIEFFEQTGRDGPATDRLKAHAASDVTWDTVESIEDVGPQTCVDFTVETHHNYVIGGIVTHNSTSLANFLLTEGVSYPQFRSLFVSPSKEQTSRFSNTRFAKALFFSPLLKKYFVTRDMPANNVTLRMLANGSEFFFSYASDDAERCRGISADRLCLDESQSISLEVVEPVVRECLAASKYKFRMYCGTPLSAENDIEIVLWQRSTKCEWAVPCQSCGARNILGWKNIGPKYLICARCEKGPLDVRLGGWVTMDPSQRLAGFRIPQIALHRNVATRRAYEDILDKQKNYSKAQFNNEVLGVSDSLGARLISLDMLRALCKEWTFDEGEQTITPKSMEGVIHLVAGVDWGGQSPTNVSRTALAIWGILSDGRLRLMFGKIYPSGHARQDIEDIVRLCRLYRVSCLIGDSGEGMLANAELRLKLGEHIAFGNRYGGMDGKIRWNNNHNAPGYNSDKTMMVDQYMQGVLAKRFEFPHWEQFTRFTDDILAEYEESTQQGRRIWKHAATRPDDFLHACVFGWLAAKVVTGEVAFYMAKEPPSDD